MLLAYWHKCPLEKISSKMYQGLKRNVWINIWTSKVALQEMFEHLQTLWHTLWLTNDLAIDNPFWLWNWSNFTTKRFSLEKGPDAGNVYQSWQSWKTKIFLILCIITPRGLRPDMFGCNPDIQTLQLRKITSNSFHRGSFGRNSLFRKIGIVPEKSNEKLAGVN